jgi:hypothetical protein
MPPHLTSTDLTGERHQVARSTTSTMVVMMKMNSRPATTAQIERRGTV